MNVKSITFSKLALFQSLSLEEIDQALDTLHCFIKTYHEKESIVRQGDLLRQFGIVIQGSAQILSIDWHGNSSLVDQLAVNEMFAESYVFANQPLAVEIVCMEMTQVLWIPKESFTAACNQGSQMIIMQNLLQLIATKNIALNRKMLIMNQKTIKEKLFAYLTQLCQEFEKPFYIPFNRQELADYLGVDRSALSYVLSRLNKEGQLSYRKNRFILHTNNLT